MSDVQRETVISGDAVPELDVPAIKFVDGAEGAPAGAAAQVRGTGLPSPSALGATFDPALATLYGSTVGQEVGEHGYDGVWGPTLNLMRSPLAGRGNEYYSEDPFLAARTAVNWTLGAQHAGTMVQLKHFVGNDQEGQAGVPIISGADGGRSDANVQIDDRTLHETYLQPFDAAIQMADAASIMCSYNKLNSDTTYNCENAGLLTGILRGSLGFRGFVASDAGATHVIPTAFAAGMDFYATSSGSAGPQELETLRSAGALTEADLVTHTLRVLRTMFDRGVFDRPAYTGTNVSTGLQAAHRAVARRIEDRAITLLRNMGSLPLQRSGLKSVAVIGTAADSYTRANGSNQVSTYPPVTPLQGIRNHVLPSTAVTFNDGTNIATAVAAARAAQVAVVVVRDVEVEGEDKPCMSLDCPGLGGLPDPQTADTQTNAQTQQPLQDELIQQVAAVNPHTIVVLETGSAVLTPWRNSVAGLLEAWYPGEEGGNAIADVLFGAVDPAGRLTATFPASDADGPATNLTRNPLEYPGVGTEESYLEGDNIGYRFDQANKITPAYPFGFGLSYGSVAFSHIRAAAGTPGGQQVARVTADVTNTSRRTVAAAPQLYLSLPSTAALPEPPSQLEGYTSFDLHPGQTAQVSFPLNERAFAHWDSAKQSWAITPGCYRVQIGPNSATLPLTAVLNRGGSCHGAALDLGITKGRLGLPVSPVPVVHLSLPQQGARPPVGGNTQPTTPTASAPAGSLSKLASTGLSSGLPASAVGALFAAAMLSRRSGRRARRHGSKP